MTVTWSSDERFRVDGVDFFCSFNESSIDLFCIRKPRRLVDETVSRFEQLRPARIIELGIAHGGSVALTTLVTSPAKLVAFELASERVAALDELIARRSLSERVRPYYGVDQSDRARVAALADEEFGGEPIDFVVDDASHLLDPTRASFEVLFPRLRPGGLFVIEDWNWHMKLTSSIARRLREERAGTLREQPHQQGAPRQLMLTEFLQKNLEHTPLETLVLEFVLARACIGDAFGNVTVGEGTVVVERGPGVLDPDTFRVADTFVDPRGLLAH